MKKLSFGNISIEDLLQFFQISQSDKILEFSKEENISREVEKVLKNLIEQNRNYIDDYLEEELKMLFIAPILNLVNFQCDNFRAWLERDFSYNFDEVEIFGKPNFMLAKGRFQPEKPIFFLQEYKKSLPNGNPKWQLISEMIIAIVKNGGGEVFGSYVVGQYWHFVKMWREGEEYIFSISESFNSLKFQELQTIYTNLQAIKSLYCKVEK